MAKLTTLEGLDMQNPYVKYGLIAAAGIGVYMLMKKSGGLSGLKDSTIGSRELVLYIENDEPLNRQINAVIKNLHKKHKKGTFDHEKSLIAWKHVVDEGVKRYSKEFGTTTKVFDSTDRKEAAKELAKDFADDIKIGLDDDVQSGMSGLSSRKVTDKVVGAFIDGKKAKVGNTSTDGTTLKLHGNTIAKKEDGKLMITDAGWATVTTKERLNGIPGVNVYQKKGVWYLNGKKWNGEWIEVE